MAGLAVQKGMPRRQQSALAPPFIGPRVSAALMSRDLGVCRATLPRRYQKKPLVDHTVFYYVCEISGISQILLLGEFGKGDR